MQDLKSLNVFSCEVGSRFLEALYHHSQTLTCLAATHCKALTPSLVPKILASFPHLESLYVGCVLDEDIIDGLPWVCEHSLKELCIGISFPLDDDAEYHQQVLQRISRLTNLKELLLDCGRRTEKSLDLSLDNGLDQLVTLKQLEKLVFYFHAETLGVRDVEWMINSWKNLKEVKGYFRQDIKEELVSMFTAAGIKFNCEDKCRDPRFCRSFLSAESFINLGDQLSPTTGVRAYIEIIQLGAAALGQ
ncbi:MAG: hypothetical protein J3Q66DRAFT_405047 [Benniella sp.]|nr:MAG: hypothetical protein J3Q66DRAFT_405047 [Benniella sp.]